MPTKSDSDAERLSSLESAPTHYGSDISDSQAPVAPTLKAPLETGWGLSSEEPTAESAFSSQEVDRYEIAGEHARGGLGRILEARDRRLGRPVAIKELLNPDGGAEARFLREATITARLEHPAIVPVHDIGRWKTGGAFYAMKMVSGRSLKQHIDACSNLDERLGLLPNVIAVADAIAYAHSEGVIHRDLKPQNVVVGAFGETIVIDWGLAKDQRADDVDEDRDDLATYRAGGALTVVGAVMGTPAYMPPEQARGEEVDERADVYSLGAMLYHLIAGHAPYGRDQSEDILSEVIAGPPRHIDPQAIHAPDDLLAVVTMAMARDPADRYPSARELAADLRRFHTGKLVSAREYSTWRLILRWIASHRAIVAVAAAALVVVTVLAVISIGRVLEEKRAAERQRIVAERRAVDLLEEKGRSELIEGQPLRALVYLSEAYSSGADSPALRSLIHDAMRTLDALELEIAVADADVVAIDVDDQGARAVVASADGKAALWNIETGQQLTAFDTKTEHLRRIDLSPDGSRVVTGSDNDGAMLWNAATGALIAKLPMGPLGSATVSFSSDGSLVLAAMGPTIGLYDAADGALVRNLADGDQYCIHTTLSPDGSLVGCAGGDGVGRVYRTATGELLARTRFEGNAMLSIAFSTDNELVAGTSNQGRVSVWRAATGELVTHLSGHSGIVLGCRFLGSSHELVTWGHDTSARIWQVDWGRQLFALEGHTELIWDVDYHEADRRLVTASFDGTAKVWDSVSGALIATLPTPTERNNLARFTLDGDHILTAGTDGRLRVWSTRVWKPRFTLRHESTLSWLTFVDEHTLMTVANDGRIRLWATDSGVVERVFDSRRPTPPGPTVVSTEATEEENERALERMMLEARHLIGYADRSADGTRLIAALGDGSVEIFDWKTGISLDAGIVHSATIRRAMFALDDTRVVTVGAKAPRVWVASTGDLEYELFGHTDEVDGLDLDPTRTRAVSASADGTARIWDLASGLEIATLSGHQGIVRQARFHPDGTIVATASDDGTARLWDAELGTPIATLSGHTSGVSDARFSPDGRYVVTVSSDKTAKVWSTRDGELITSLDGHTGAIVSAAFSPDGSVLVTGSEDMSAGVWTVPGGKLLASLELHSDVVVSVAVSPEGKLIATSGRDGIATIWDASGDTRTPEQLREIVDTRIPWRLVDGRLIPTPRQATPSR